MRNSSASAWGGGKEKSEESFGAGAGEAGMEEDVEWTQEGVKCEG